MASVKFWYEFASPYSYFSMMRIEALAKRQDIDIVYQPFLLGPLFKEFGWDNSPFMIYKEKGAHFFRDIERETAFYKLPPLQVLEEFPQRGLAAARVAMVGLDKGWGVEFSKAIYCRQFQQGLPIKEQSDVEAVLGELGVDDISGVMAQASGDDVKSSLRAVTGEAKAAQIFGAPSFVVGDELFWGNDRLERALDFAASLSAH